MDPVETLETVAWADPGISSETSHEAEQATRALAELRPEQRQVLELGLLHGLTQSEIAARLSMPLGHGEVVYAAGPDQGARIHEHRCRTHLERGLMAEPGPQDQLDEATVDLLIKQVTEGLSPAEQRALDVLDSAVVSDNLRALERAAAAIALGASANAPQLPPDLAQRIAHQANEHFGAAGLPAAGVPRAGLPAVGAPGAVPPNAGLAGEKLVDLAAARAAPRAPRHAPAFGNYGWFAAAACLVLAVFAWNRSPPPAATVAIGASRRCSTAFARESAGGNAADARRGARGAPGEARFTQDQVWRHQGPCRGRGQRRCGVGPGHAARLHALRRPCGERPGIAAVPVMDFRRRPRSSAIRWTAVCSTCRRMRRKW